MRKFLSILLTVCMLVSMLPAGAWAAEAYNGGLCPHHTEHTADCGHIESAEGIPCGYACEICAPKAETADISEAADSYPVMVLANDGKYSGGDGSAESPYQISSANDMWYLSDHDEDWNKHFELTENIDLGGREKGNWSPIGMTAGSGIKFTGTFDGKDHTISGLYINTTKTYQGLFGDVFEGDISNLKVDGEIHAAGNVGGIVGYLGSNDTTKGSVVNCSFSGTIERIDTTGTAGTNTAVGGIVGDNHGGKVTDCHNRGNLTLNTADVGGIVGVNETINSIVQNCYNEGTINVSGNTAGHVGGIAGRNITSAKIINCHNEGTVDGTGSAGNIGGIAGQNNGSKVIQCYNNGTVTGSNSVGGIVGQNTASATIDQCYNTAAAAVTGTGSIGGIAGANEEKAAVTNCYNEANVSGTTYVGGIVGRNNNGATKSTTVGSVARCYNRGGVSGSSFVGAIVGENDHGTGKGNVTTCYYLTDTASGGMNGADTDGKAEVKTEDQFRSGEICWLLQHDQNDQGLFWGQEIVKTDTDPYPLLVNTVAGAHSRRVLRATFRTNANASYRINYTNDGGAVTAPVIVVPSAGAYVFHEWRIGGVNGAKYENVVTEENKTAADEIIIVAVQREKYAGENATVTLTTTYSLSEQTIDTSLDIFMSYAADTSTDGKFNYTIKADTNTCDGAVMTGNKITIPAKKDVGEYTLTVVASEKDAQVSTYALGPYGTSDVEIPVKVIIVKATPEITVDPTAQAIDYGKALSDSKLSGGKAMFEGEGVDGLFKWNPNTIKPEVSDSGTTEYTVIFEPTDSKNYNAVETKITLNVNKISPSDMVPPQANDLTYNGDAQYLITKGSAVGGEMKYWLAEPDEAMPDADTQFSSQIPSRTNAGEYTVYYKVIGDSNHTDTEPLSVKVTIKQYELTVSPNPVIYNGGNEFPLTVTGVKGENISVTLIANQKDVRSGGYSFGDTSGEGKYTAAIADPQSNNYKVIGGGELTINPIPAILQWESVPEPSSFTIAYDSKTHTVSAHVSNKQGADTDEDFKLAYEPNGPVEGGGQYATEAADTGSYIAKVIDLGNPNYTLRGGQQIEQPWRIFQSDDIIKLTYEPLDSADDPNRFVYGGRIRLTAEISADSGGIRPDDIVTFYINGKAIKDMPVTVSDGGKKAVAETVLDMNSVNAFFAGLVPLRANYSGNVNLMSESIDAGTIPVEQKPLEVKIEGETSKIYDGNDIAHTLSIGLDADEICTGDNVSVFATSFNYGSKNAAASNAITISGISLSGAQSGNYSVDDTAVTDGSITARPIKLEWRGFSTRVYNGLPSTVTATAIELADNSDVVNVTVENGDDNANAGTYIAKATGLTGKDGGNYTLPAASNEREQSYTIEQAVISIPSRSFVYNKSNTLTLTLNGVTPPGGETEQVEITITANSADANRYSYSAEGGDGTYTAAFTNDRDRQNYKIEGEDLTIEKADPDCTAPSDRNSVYSGAQQELIVAGKTADGTIVYSFDFAGTYEKELLEGLGVGTYQVWYRVIGDKNHNNSEPQSILAHIRPAEIDISKQTFTYNGGTDFSVELPGVIGGETVTAAFVTSSPNVGKYTAEANIAGFADGGEERTYTAVLSNSNYVIGEKQVLEIVPKEIGLIWGEYSGLVYTGKHGSITVTADGLIGSDTCEIEAENIEWLDAKEYTAKAVRLLNNPNYKLPEEDLTLEYIVEPAKLIVPAKTVTYSGEKRFGVDVEGVNDETVHVTIIADSEDVGMYTYAEGASSYRASTTNTNYEIVDGEPLTIEKADPTYTKPEGCHTVYNGKPQVLVTAGSTEDGTMEYSLSESGPWSTTLPAKTEARTYTVWYRVVGDKNHNNVTPQFVEATIVSDDPDEDAPTDSNHPTNPGDPTPAPGLDDPTDSTPSPSPDTPLIPEPSKPVVPQTGEESNFALWFAWMFISLAGLAGCAALKKKKGAGHNAKH